MTEAKVFRSLVRLVPEFTANVYARIGSHARVCLLCDVLLNLLLTLFVTEDVPSATSTTSEG